MEKDDDDNDYEGNKNGFIHGGLVWRAHLTKSLLIYASAHLPCIAIFEVTTNVHQITWTFCQRRLEKTPEYSCILVGFVSELYSGHASDCVWFSVSFWIPWQINGSYRLMYEKTWNEISFRHHNSNKVTIKVYSLFYRRCYRFQLIRSQTEIDLLRDIPYLFIT